MIPNLQSHYGFTRMPFTASVPVAALFSSAACKEAVTRLRWLISARGLGVLTGEVGAGKTAALRAAADGLDAFRNALIYLPNPQIGVRGIHGAVAQALGQVPRFHHAEPHPPGRGRDRRRGRRAQPQRHPRHRRGPPAHRRAAGKHPDDDQPLARQRLAAHHPAHRPAHLRRRLRVGDMAALDQRVQLKYAFPVPAITAAEASGYIRAHLSHAGRTDTLFSDNAVRVIHGHARGMPRAINRLAVTALLAACTQNKTIADEQSARTAIAEETASATD